MALPGQWRVDNAGAFDYTVPIKEPPGTHGMAPHLALAYSSRGGDGYVGIGWSVSGLSAITRCGQTYAQDGKHGGVNFDANDRFCLDGQRLVVVAGSYGADGSEYRTLIESFRKIVFHTQGANCGVSCFDVWAKNGTHYQYGYTVNSNGGDSGAQVYAYKTNTIVRVWALNQATDTTGNYIAYSYSDLNNDADYVPKRIDYTGNSANGGNATYNWVRFVYTSRPDIVPSYEAGYLVQPQDLLTDIETYHRGVEVLDYKLSYNDTASGPVSHNELNAITLYDGASHSIAPTTFGWQGSGTQPAVSENAVSGIDPGDALAAADIDGDGLTDALVLTTACYSGGDIFRGTQSGGFQSANMNATYDYFPDGNDTPTHYSGGACFQNEESVFGDIDADGLADLAIDIDYYDQAGRKIPSAEILVNDGNKNLVQKNADGQFAAPFIFTSPYDNFPSDLNADGMSDGVWEDGNSHLQAEIGDGSGKNFSQFDLGAIPVGTWWQAGDFAGNGCSGLLLQGGVSETAIFCDPASSQNQVNYQTFPAPNFGTWGVIFGDFNGDGLTDVLALTQTAAKLYLSTGTGFATPKAVTLPWTNCTVVAGDWNGDGKTDIALISQNQNKHLFYLSTGTGFTELGSGLTNTDGPNSPTVADWNNDGAADIMVQIPQGSAKEIAFAFTPELMTSVSNGIGAQTTIGYDRLNHATIYTKGSGAKYPMQDFNGAIYAVSSVQTSGGGTARGWTYAYTGLEIDHSGRGLLGFQQIRTTDQQTGIVRTVDYGKGGAAGMQFPYNMLVYSDTSVSGSTTLSSRSNIWGINDPNACPNQNGGANIVVCLEQTVASGTDLDGKDAWPTTTTTYTYDGYGNILTKSASVTGGGATFVSTTTNTWNYDQDDWIVDQPATSKTENTNANSDLTRRYAFYEANAGTGEITEADIEPENKNNQDSTWLVATYGYDNWGNLSGTTYTGWNIASRTSQVQYDANGEFPDLVTNALSQSETPTFDQDWGTIAGLVDLNNHTTTWVRDSFGRPQTLTRVDGTTANVADYYCAGVGVGGSPYVCPTNGAFVEVTQDLGAPVGGSSIQNAPATLVFYDALGRVIAQDVQAFDGNWNQVDTEYDSNGYVAEKSRPYETALSTAQCPEGSVCTTFQNDILGRVQSASYPNDKGGTSSTGYQYEGLTTIVTNDLGQSTATTRNVQGLVASVTDANNRTTSYAYDAFGDLLTVGTPKHANQLANTWDVRGRKTTSTDLDMGDWQYGYDSLGELVTQISPTENNKGEATALGYDLLGRLQSRTEPDMSANWYYDQAANGVGLPYQATCQGNACAGAAGGQFYVRTYWYDSFSRPSKLTVDYPSLGTFTSSESYDGTNGGTGTERLTTVMTFSGFQYTNGYNSVGYLDQIADANSGAVYWTANAMDASGNLKQETAGNGVTTYRTFWPESGRIEQIEAEGSGAPPGGQGTTIANLSYNWDTIGNLTSRGDTVNGVAENFCYFDNAGGTANVLNRLSGYSVGSADASCADGSLVKSMAYDDDGNIAQKSDIGAYTYGQGGAGPHALSSIATNAGVLVDGVANPNFSYDLDGNMTCVNAVSGCTGAARSYGWTSFDRVATITQGASGATLAYDPEHNRGSLTDASSGNTTWYFRNPAAGSASELLSGATSVWRDYLVAYGEIVAERFNAGGTPTMYYFVADHLASTTALTDPNANEEEYDSYDAWGKRRNANGSDKSNCLSLHPQSLTLRGFTGQEMMDAYCLVNLNARLYDPALGRMLSADPTVPDPMNGQSFNRYSYVINNPLALVDPSGYTDICTHEPSECKNIVLWGGGSCLNCSDPWYQGYTAMSMFLAFGGLGGMGGAGEGFGGGNGAYMGSISGDDTEHLGFVPDLNAQCDGIDCVGSFSLETAEQPETVEVFGYTYPDPYPWWEWPEYSGQYSEAPAREPNWIPHVGDREVGEPSLSMGIFASFSTIPFTSDGGGTSGTNYQYVEGSDEQWYQFSGSGQGLNLGASIQSSWAWGSGQWTGQFNSVNVSIGLFSGSVYWTPSPGGWFGVSFGFSAGLPVGLSYETVNYSDLSGF